MMLPMPKEDADIIGRWCDSPAGEIVIRRTADGLVATSDILKGFRLTQAVEREGDVFRVRQSHHGDGFRILANGDLQLFDRSGPIRTARKAGRSCASW